MNKRSIALLSLCLGLAACGAAEESDTTTTSTTTPAEETTTTMEPPPRAPNVDLGALPDWFQDEDAAPEELIEVIGDELDADYVGSMAVDWRTAGIGCSDGGAELQVITPGYVIFYEDPDGLVRVHTAENGRWKVCDLARPFDGIPTVTS